MRAERSFAGLPMRAAATFLMIAIVAFIFYPLVWPSSPTLDGDSAQYMEVARDLTDFRLDNLHYRSPGYPALIALTGSAETPARSLLYVSLLLHFASVWLLASILRSAGVDSGKLTLFVVLLALPPYVEPAGFVMTENLAQFALCLGLAGLVQWFARKRAAWLIASSVGFGLAGLTRPIYQVLGLSLAAGLIFLPGVVRRVGVESGQALKAGVAFVAGAVLILGSLVAYNQATFGYFGVAPSLGFHLSTKTMAWVERLPDEYATARDILVRERSAELTKLGGKHNSTQTIWNAREELGRATGLDLPALSSYLVKMNLAIIRRAPIEFLEEVARAVPSYWFPAAGPLATMQSSVLRWTWGALHLAVIATFFLQLMVLAGVGLFEWSRRSSGQAFGATPLQKVSYLLGSSVVAYTMVLTCVIDIGEPRQRRPTDVVVLLLCFLAAHVWNRARKHTM